MKDSSLRTRLREALLRALESVTDIGSDQAGRTVPQGLLDGLRDAAGADGALLLVAAAHGPAQEVEARLWMAGEEGEQRGGAVDLAVLDPGATLLADGASDRCSRSPREQLGGLEGRGGPPAGPLVHVELPLEEGLRGVLALEFDATREPEGLEEVLVSIARPVGGVLRAVEVIRRLDARASIHRSLVESGEQLVHSVGPDGSIQFVNEHWLRTLGYERSELDRKSIFDLIAPRSMEHCQAAFEGLFRGEAVTGADVTFLRSDGTEVELHGDIFPRFVDGRLVSTQAFLRDVTEERRDERRRASGQALLDAVVENAPEAICFLGVDGRVQRINREFTRLFGYEPEEAFGRHIDELVVPPDRREEAGHICRLAGEAELVNQEVVRRGKDGSPVTVSLLAAPVVLEGTQLGIVAIYRDVSEQRELEARLARSQRMEALGRLAGGIAHDFNNLLTVIQLSAEYVLDQVPERHELRPPVEEIAVAGQSAATLTRRLLEFGRRHVVQPEAVDVNRLVSELVPMLRRLLGEDRELVLELDHARPCGVLSDPGQLEQVIVNLALNARDAMAGGGRLTIGARPLEVGPGLAARAEVDPGRFIEVRVEDTGAGMSPEVLDRIFEPFYSTKASEGRGSGLGLATVYGYLEQCRGGILVESEVGSGSTFRLLLPQQELAAVREDEVVIESTAEGEVGPATVLLVEDEAAIRLMVETALSRVGHRVVVAESPEDALELAEQQGDAVDLLLTDVVMPGMGGPELAATLREQRPGLRVLYMSGFNDDQLLRRGLERGEAQFLAKPFSIQTLLEQVRGALGRSPASGS